jgi:integrase/recombinase XerD
MDDDDLHFDRLQEFLRAKAVSQNTRRAYAQDLQLFQRWSGTPWEAITPPQVAAFKAYLEQPQQPKRRSPATVRRILSSLRSFYQWMVRSGYLERNPSIAVDLPKLPDPKIDYLSDAQVAAIFQAAIRGKNLPERNVALLWVLCHNLRASEVSALDYGDYDGMRLVIRRGKSGSQGVVPLGSEARSWLDTYLRWRETEGEVLDPLCPLFLSHSRQNNGQRLGYGGIRKLMDGLSMVVGFKFHAHQFRHTYATNLVLKGMNPFHVMTLTRHRSSQNFRRYSKAAEQIAAEQAFYSAIGEAHPEA